MTAVFWVVGSAFEFMSCALRKFSYN